MSETGVTFPVQKTPLAALYARRREAIHELVTGRMERQAERMQFWRGVYLNEEEKMVDRLKASNFAAQADGDYYRHRTPDNTDRVAKSYRDLFMKAMDAADASFDMTTEYVAAEVLDGADVLQVPTEADVGDADEVNDNEGWYDDDD